MQQTSIIVPHAIRRDFESEPTQHFVGWSFQRRSLDNRADGDDRCWTRLHRLAYTRDSQDSPNANHRVAGTNQNCLRLCQGLAHTRSWLRLFHAVIDNLLDLLLAAALHQVFLEVE